MENASKALLIAASVLIAILLIGTGMKIFKSTSGTTDSVGDEMSTTEISLVNDKYYEYAGNNKTVADIRNLCNRILANNATSENKINMIKYQKAGKEDVQEINIDSYNVRTFLANLSESKLYSIQPITAANGYVHRIFIKEN